MVLPLLCWAPEMWSQQILLVCGKGPLWDVQCYRMRGTVNLAGRFRSKKACAGPESQCSFTECHLSAFSLLFRYDTAVKSKMLKYHVKANLWYVCRRVLKFEMFWAFQRCICVELKLQVSASKSFELLARSCEVGLCVLTESFSSSDFPLDLTQKGELVKISIGKSVAGIGLKTSKAVQRKIHSFLHSFFYHLLLGTPLEMMPHLQLALRWQTEDTRD